MQSTLLTKNAVLVKLLLYVFVLLASTGSTMMNENDEQIPEDLTPQISKEEQMLENQTLKFEEEESKILKAEIQENENENLNNECRIYKDLYQKSENEEEILKKQIEEIYALSEVIFNKFKKSEMEKLKVKNEATFYKDLNKKMQIIYEQKIDDLKNELARLEANQRKANQPEANQEIQIQETEMKKENQFLKPKFEEKDVENKIIEDELPSSKEKYEHSTQNNILNENFSEDLRLQNSAEKEKILAENPFSLNDEESEEMRPYGSELIKKSDDRWEEKEKLHKL